MSLAGLSISRPVLVTMSTLFLIVLGALALRTIPVDLYPSIAYPVLAVRAELKGAAPEEIEQLITKKLEDTLSTVSDVQTIRSISREGSSIVILEFNQGADIKFQEIQVRAKVGNLRRSLPDNMSEPNISRQDPDDSPIIELALTGDRPASELTDIAKDNVILKLQQIAGVGEVSLGGEVTEEIHVELKPDVILSFQLNPTDIVQAISRSNRNEPVGKITGSERNWVIRSTAQATHIKDLENISVGKTLKGEPLFLRDVATLTRGYAERRSISRFGSPNSLVPAVLIDVVKQSGENTVEISDQVLSEIEKIRESLPSDVRLDVTTDNADLIRSNVADVFESLIIAGFLTIAVVLLFLRSPRSTLTTGLALPSSVITTFAMMWLAGFSINVMTLLALSLSIGMLVDDAIVVRENIFRHMNKGNLSPKEASLKGTNEVTLAVIATTLTVVAVFLPVAFMGGVTGQFFKPFALTVVFAMLVSLWDALTMAPMLSAYFANIPDPATEWKAFGKAGTLINHGLMKFEHGFFMLEKVYEKILRFLTRNTWFVISVASASLALAWFGFTLIKKSFLPTQLGKTFSASVQGPLAVPPEQVLSLSDTLNKKLQNIEALEFWTMSAGTGFTGQAQVRLSIQVKEAFGKNQTALAEARSQVRKALTGIPGYNARISEPADPLAGGGGSRFAPIIINVAGNDITALNELAAQVNSVMASTSGIVDVAPLQSDGLPELKLSFNNAMAAQFGVSSQMLTDNLTIMVQGDSSNSLSQGNDQIPIRVRFENGDQNTISEILQQNIVVRGSGALNQNFGAGIVPIGNLVSLEASAGPALINRENRKRLVRMGGNIEQGQALGTVVSELKDNLKSIPLASDQEISVLGQNQQMDELYTNILIAIALGSLFVYMVLASLFESFLQPFAVMAAIPLAATGAVGALLLFNLPLDLYGGIGLVLLAGIVAKNSILLVDFAMQRVREKGEDPLSAILESAPLRLRPILMTSIAMIAGMIPVAAGLGSGGEARKALGIATIGGVISSTFLTLLVVPNLYILIERFSAFFKRKIPSQKTTH